MDGKLSIVQGDPGDGKSTLILNIAVKLSRGECIDENMNITEPVNEYIRRQKTDLQIQSRRGLKLQMQTAAEYQS